MKKVTLIIPLIATLLLVALYYLGLHDESIQDYLGKPAQFAAFLTAVLTFWYVIYTARMVQGMQEQILEQRMPLINIRFSVKDKLLYIHIENIGKLPAENLTIRSIPEINTNLIGQDLMPWLFGRPVSYFGSGQSIRTLVGSVPTINHEHPELANVELTIQYDCLGRTEVKTMQINLHSFGKQKQATVTPNPRTIREKQVESIARSLRMIADELRATREND